jgi:hypothetical protein
LSAAWALGPTNETADASVKAAAALNSERRSMVSSLDEQVQTIWLLFGRGPTRFQLFQYRAPGFLVFQIQGAALERRRASDKADRIAKARRFSANRWQRVVLRFFNRQTLRLIKTLYFPGLSSANGSHTLN